MKYQIFDGETENREHFGRFSSPWHPDNYMVAHGWKNKGDKQCSYSYQDNKEQGHSWSIPETCEVLVGHNLRFDLTWVWKEDTLVEFIKRGGKVWCTQYAEYLLEGHDDEYHMNSLEDVSVKYGGTRKVDAVKAMWDEGKLTSEIPRDLLIDYLIGTKEEDYNGGDIGNTELVYLAQIKRAEELGMTAVIQARMDGYLATTEMEYNGINVDVGIAFTDMMEQQQQAKDLLKGLDALLPDVGIPELATFNWGSGSQVSCLLFGGAIMYEWSDNYIDDETGVLARTQINVKHAYVPEVSTDKVFLVPVADLHKVEGDWYCPLGKATLVKSGKKKGELKTKNLKLPLGNIKTRRFNKLVKFPRQILPLADWKIANTDALDLPLYSTGAGVVASLLAEDNEIAKSYAVWKRLVKVVDTYYMKTTAKRDKKTGEVRSITKGMLTFVKPNGILNHYLNHTSTVTSRMSAKAPNLQNIPRGDTAVVKRMFTSRYGVEGVCTEADYSQLEVVVNGYLTGDKNLIRDLKAGVDFHCKHVALKNHIPYEEAYDLCKVQKLPQWVSERTKCKGYTFQSEYGAGDTSIAKATGMQPSEVKGIRDAVALEYPVKTAFVGTVKAEVEGSAVPYRIKFPHGGYKYIQKGYYVSPTGTRFCFRSEDAPSWLKEKGVDQTFKPTKLMNYPTQGTGGEIMQILVGVLFRKCVAKGWWSGNPQAKALLVNTVHDCVWGDSHESVYQEFGTLISSTLSSVPSVYKELFNITMDVDFPVDIEYGRDMLNLGHTLNT